MPKELGVRTQIALLLFTTLNIAAFTAVVYVVMLSPSLTDDAGYWMIVSMVGSVLISAPLAWLLAPCINEKWHRKLLAKPSPLARVRPRSIRKSIIWLTKSRCDDSTTAEYWIRPGSPAE